MKDAELIGWIAVAVLLSNHFLLSWKIFSPEKNLTTFFIIQFLGAVLMLFTALLLNFLPLIVLQGVIIATNIYRIAQLLMR